MIKRSFIYIFVLTMLLGLAGCAKQEKDDSVNKNINDNKITVAVSIAPQEAFVKAVAGDMVNIVTMIPPGYSPTNYQPTPKQMESFSKASIYFSIGVPTEEANILPKAKDLNEDMSIVSLVDKVGEIYPHRYFEEDEEHDHHNEEDNHYHSGRDPHIWLSPKRVKIMIEVIADELARLDTNNSEIYKNNAKLYLEKLDHLDQEIIETLNTVKGEAFIMYHPSLGYLADDYGLEMISIEKEGKEATAKELEEVIELAKVKGIKVVFYQAEFDSKQAKTLSDEIGGKTEMIDPLSSNYIGNLKKISDTFKSVMK